MDISTLSTWLGIISGTGFCATTVWGTFRWFKARLARTQEAAVLGEDLADELLNHATSATRRADIHAYILFNAIETEAEHTRSVVVAGIGGLALLATGLVIAIIWRTFDIDSHIWLWRSLIATYISGIASYMAAIFFSRQIWRIQIGWHSSAKSALQDKAFRHVTRK